MWYWAVSPTCDDHVLHRGAFGVDAAFIAVCFIVLGGGANPYRLFRVRGNEAAHNDMVRLRFTGPFHQHVISVSFGCFVLQRIGRGCGVSSLLESICFGGAPICTAYSGRDEKLPYWSVRPRLTLLTPQRAVIL